MPTNRDLKPHNVIPKTPRERTHLGLLADAATREAVAIMPWIVWALVFGALIALAGALGGCAPTDEPAPALGRACECEAYPCAPDDCAGATCYGGTCSQRCERDDDCPAGALCDVGSPGGCRWSCSSAADCPDLDVAVCERGMCYAGPGGGSTLRRRSVTTCGEWGQCACWDPDDFYPHRERQCCTTTSWDGIPGAVTICVWESQLCGGGPETECR